MDSSDTNTVETTDVETGVTLESAIRDALRAQQARVEDQGVRAARSNGWCGEFSRIMASVFPEGPLLNDWADSDGVGCNGEHVRDADGYDRSGFNREGFNREGLDREGFHRDAPERYRYNRYGYDTDGYNAGGTNRFGRTREQEARAREGAYVFDADGYTIDGFDRSGYHRSNDTFSEQVSRLRDTQL